jgi:RNA polymerase sigma-70 factor (ECF subfamily)
MVAPITPVIFSPVSPPATTREARAAFSRREAAHDAVLVRRFNSGDQAAFAEIVARYRERLSQIAWRLLKNQADAEEIAQDAFVRAYRGLANFRGDSSLYSWLHRITLNLSRNRYWYFSRRRQHLTQSLDGTVSEHSPSVYADLVASTAPGPVRETSNREFLALVAACMDRLNSSQREVLGLCVGQQCSYREIGRRLRINPGTVKSRIARARERLRTLLAETYAGSSRAPAGSASPWFEPHRAAGLVGIVEN